MDLQKSVQGGKKKDTIEPILPKKTDNDMDDEKTKMSKKQIVGLVVLSMIAIAGVLFGVYGMSSQQEKISELTVRAEDAEGKVAKLIETEKVTIEQPDGTIAEVANSNKIPNELARNLIEPYLGTFVYLDDVFDYEFNENTKFFLAYLNTDRNADVGNEAVMYNAINNEYKYLFGDEKDLDKTNYEAGYRVFTYVNDSGLERFNVVLSGGGGTGATLFSVIKEANYDNDSIEVQVYHGHTFSCEILENDGYCLDVSSRDVESYYTAMTPEIEKLVDDERTETFKMTFVKNNGHYVLNAIEKI